MPMPAGAGVGGRCARPICGGRGCAGCAQDGGVVRMDDGAVTFKGGTISRAVAVRVRVLRSHVACRKCSCLTLHVARAGACHVMGMPRLWRARTVQRRCAAVHVVCCALCVARRRSGAYVSTRLQSFGEGGDPFGRAALHSCALATVACTVPLRSPSAMRRGFIYTYMYVYL